MEFFTSEVYLLFIYKTISFNHSVQHIFYFDNEYIVRKGYKGGF